MRTALIGFAILCGSSACSQQPAPVDTPKSRFTQQGLDAISQICGVSAGSLRLEGASSVRFGTTVTGDFKVLNCVQTKIREIYYPNAKTGVGNELNESEGKNAQAH